MQEWIESAIGENYDIQQEDCEDKFNLIADSLEAQKHASTQASSQEGDAADGADLPEDQLDLYDGMITCFSIIVSEKFSIKQTLKNFMTQFLEGFQQQSESFCYGMLAGLLYANKAIQGSYQMLMQCLKQAYAIFQQLKRHWEQLNIQQSDFANDLAAAGNGLNQSGGRS